MNPLFLGLDLGTTGVRVAALNSAATVEAEVREPMPSPVRQGSLITQDPAQWWTAARRALGALMSRIDPRRVAALAVDGTSGTLLLTDAAGKPLTAGWMYNEATCKATAARIATHAPAHSPAQGLTSPLARLLHLQALHPEASHVLHQADWITGCLRNQFGISDENNVLKLGYDVIKRCWPTWFEDLDLRTNLLPKVVPPGTPLGVIDPAVAQTLGLPPDVLIASGTTDGVAAFLATGAKEVGDAVTSLGSTLVIKLLSNQPLFAPEYGIYSHRLGDRWLPGGASNSGGAALLVHFSAERMVELTPALRPDEPTGLDYYPLPATGERFPHNDPNLPSRCTPRPTDDVHFFQALLEGVAGVEALAFERLQVMGAPAPRCIFSVGGGAHNQAWTRIRTLRLGVPVLQPLQHEAACGAARLALQAWNFHKATQ